MTVRCQSNKCFDNSSSVRIENPNTFSPWRKAHSRSNTFCISSPSSRLPSQFPPPFSGDDFGLDGAAFSSAVSSYLRGFSHLWKPEKPACCPPNPSPLPPCTRVSLSALLSESVSSLSLCLRLPLPPCYLVSLPALLSESVSSLCPRLRLPLSPCYLGSLPSLPSESVSSLSLRLRLPLPLCYPVSLPALPSSSARHLACRSQPAHPCSASRFGSGSACGDSSAAQFSFLLRLAAAPFSFFGSGEDRKDL